MKLPQEKKKSHSVSPKPHPTCPSHPSIHPSNFSCEYSWFLSLSLSPVITPTVANRSQLLKKKTKHPVNDAPRPRSPLAYVRPPRPHRRGRVSRSSRKRQRPSRTASRSCVRGRRSLAPPAAAATPWYSVVVARFSMERERGRRRWRGRRNGGAPPPPPASRSTDRSQRGSGRESGR